MLLIAGGRIPATLDSGVVLGTPAVATIMILDDDHAGVLTFEGGLWVTLFVRFRD